MAANYWLKLYHEILDDRKMAILSDRIWRRAIECFLLAGEKDEEGILPSLEDMAWRMRMESEMLETDLVELAKIGVISQIDGNWIVTNFEKRQRAMTSTERTRRSRGQQEPTWRQKIYDELPATSGVYRIYFMGSPKNRIGASKNIRQRIRQHLTEISTIPGTELYEDFLQHGKENLRVEVLEKCEIKELSDKEKEWMLKYEDTRYVSLVDGRGDSGGRHHSWEEE